MAAINRLTALQVKSLGEGSHSDGGNLYLRVRGNGRRWVFRYKIPKGWHDEGKPVEIGLGSANSRSLADARKLAARMRAEIEDNRDPAILLKPMAEPLAKTFKDYAGELIESKKAGWRNGKHLAQWPATLTTYAYPFVGTKRPGAITVSDVQAILNPLWATKTETATRVRQRVEAVIDYAFVVEGIDRRNPARWKGNLDKIFPAPRKMAGKVKHHAAPPWADVPGIMAKLREKESMSALALRFSVLTAARSMEVRAADWSEIDTDKALWNVPEGRMKGGEAHTVPLSAEALEIIATAAERHREKRKSRMASPQDDAALTGRVFPGPTGGLLSDVAINKTLHAITPDITAHGLARSCFRDWGAEATSFPSAVLEAALAHKNTNRVEAAYLRSKFLEKRVELMAAWANFLKGGSNVVALAQADAA